MARMVRRACVQFYGRLELVDVHVKLYDELARPCSKVWPKPMVKRSIDDVPMLGTTH
jgi:hypothetical protein